jgi:hypothetical protein
LKITRKIDIVICFYICNIINKITIVQREINEIDIVLRFLNSTLSVQIFILKKVYKILYNIISKEINNLGMVVPPALRKQK